MDDQLTLEQFAATLMWQIASPNEYSTLWLASSEEHKAERLALLHRNFKKWKAHEIEMKKRREIPRHVGNEEN